MKPNESRAAPRILIADDSEIVRIFLFEALASQGYEVIEAVDGEQALALLREQIPDLAVLDIAMPQRSGIEVCRIAKADPTLRSIPIVFLSGRGDFATKIAGRRAGAAEYVTKPFDESVLLMLVARHLSAEGGAEEDAS